MWTATVKSKEEKGGIISVTVDFSNGEKTITETCRSAYINDIKAWARSRVNEFTKAKELDTVLAVDDVIDIAEEVVAPVAPTQAEVERSEWMRDYWKLQQVQKLIDLAVLTGNETPIVNLRNKVKTNFKTAYIDTL